MVLTGRLLAVWFASMVLCACANNSATPQGDPAIRLPSVPEDGRASLSPPHDGRAHGAGPVAAPSGAAKVHDDGARVHAVAPVADAAARSAPRRPQVVRQVSPPAEPASAAQTPSRGPVKGWLVAPVTSSISVFDTDGRVAQRVPRAGMPLPAEGLAFFDGPRGLVVADYNGRSVILDTSEFEVRMADPLVKRTCKEMQELGIAPTRIAPGSMGHGECR